MGSQPYIGEVMMFGGNFAPLDWAFCQGQLQSIAQNEALYTLIGTTYGGDGVNTFGLPNLQSRVPIHMGQLSGGQNYIIGQVGGVEQVSLTSQTMPQHQHQLFATTSAANSLNITNTSLPGDVTGDVGGVNFYVITGGDTTPTQLASPSVGLQGGSLPHENRMPTLCVSFCIALFGVYPSQN